MVLVVEVVEVGVSSCCSCCCDIKCGRLDLEADTNFPILVVLVLGGLGGFGTSKVGLPCELDDSCKSTT